MIAREQRLFERARHLAKGEERCRARAERLKALLSRFVAVGAAKRFPTTTDMLKGECMAFLVLANRCRMRRRELLEAS